MDRRKLLLVVAVVVALLGAGLVFVYAKGADSRAAQAYDPVTVYVAQQDIAVGESFDTALSTQKIVAQEIPSTARVPSAIDAVDQLAGQTANTNIATGEQILTSNYGGEGASTPLAIPAGMVAVSVQLTDTARVAGFVNAGSEVAMWLTQQGDETDPTRIRLLLDRVQVIAVGSTSTQTTTTSTGDAGEPAVVEQMPRTLVTFAVKQEDAERIKLGASIGEIELGVLTDKSGVKSTKGLKADSVFR